MFAAGTLIEVKLPDSTEYIYIFIYIYSLSTDAATIVRSQCALFFCTTQRLSPTSVCLQLHFLRLDTTVIDLGGMDFRFQAPGK